MLPEGFEYHADWITPGEEQHLLTAIEKLSFSEVRMHGVVARRKVVHFGWDYGYDSWKITRTDPIPDWLLFVRARAAGVLRVPEDAIQEVLVTRYEPGAGIGWHRDAPMFGPAVLGVSLVGRCRMRFQRTIGGNRHTAETVLEPRSSYVLAGTARVAWQHSIPPAKELRYSITFRTLKAALRSSPAEIHQGWLRAEDR